MWANSTTGFATQWICQGDKFKGLQAKLTIAQSKNIKQVKLTIACSILLSIEPWPAPDALQKKSISSIWLVGNIFIDYALQKIRLVPLVGKVDRCWITYAPVLVHLKDKNFII